MAAESTQLSEELSSSDIVEVPPSGANTTTAVVIVSAMLLVVILELIGAATGSNARLGVWWHSFALGAGVAFLLLFGRLMRSKDRRKAAELEAQVSVNEADIEVLSRDHAFLQNVLDAISDSTVVIDAKHQVLLANRAARETFEWHAQDGAILQCTDLYGGCPDADAAPCPVHQAFDTGEPATLERERKTRTGETRIFEVTASPIVGPDGSVIQVVETARDVTIRRKSEDQMLRLQTALDDANDAVAVVKKGGAITYVNMAFHQRFHATVETLEETGLNVLFQDPKVAEEIREAVLAGESWRGEVKMASCDGAEFPAELRATPIYDEHAYIDGALILVNDISDRKRLESQLLESQKLRSIGQLAAGVAHEINTPIQYIGDNTRFLQKTFADFCAYLQTLDQLVNAAGAHDALADAVQIVEAARQGADVEYLLEETPAAITETIEGIEQVARIVRAMKEFSHPGVEGKAHIDLNRVIESTATVARNEWKYVANLELDLDPNLPTAPCVPGEISQVLLNIIVNAAYAIGKKNGDDQDARGRITIRTRNEGDRVHIAVEDTGGGIPDSIRQKVFEPFFTSKPVGEGTGQGLDIARRVIVEGHHGQLEFETTPGEGTTFHIRLPITEPIDVQPPRDELLTPEVLHV